MIDFANHAKKLTLLSYATSEQFLILANKFKDAGIAVYTPEAPEEASEVEATPEESAE